MKEAAEALAIKAQKQEVQAKQEPPALRERTTDQPVIGKETGEGGLKDIHNKYDFLSKRGRSAIVGRQIV